MACGCNLDRTSFSSILENVQRLLIGLWFAGSCGERLGFFSRGVCVARAALYLEGKTPSLNDRLASLAIREDIMSVDSLSKELV